jgi:hypothetical protein
MSEAIVTSRASLRQLPDTGNPEVIGAPVGLVPRNALVSTNGTSCKPTYHYRSACPNLEYFLIANDPRVGSRTARTGAPARYSPTFSLSCDCVWISQLNGQPETGEELCLTSRAQLESNLLPSRTALHSSRQAPATPFIEVAYWTTASYTFALNSGKLSLSRENWCLTTSGHATATCAE